MYPFIHFLGINIPTYGLCAITGALVCGILVAFYLRGRRDYSKAHMTLMLVAAMIGAFVGAKIVYAITRVDAFSALFTHWDYYMSSWDNALKILGSIFGGMVFYGGLLGALIGAKIYCKVEKLSFDTYSDIFAPYIPLFHAFGRLGCTFAGCCYGIESDFGFHTTPHVEGVADVSRLPIQLIEAGCNIVLMVILLLIRRKNLKKGSLLGIYFMLYPIVRFTDEFFRGDDIRGRLFGLTTSQWISIGVFIVGVFMLLNRYVLPNKDKFGYNVKKGDIPEGCAYHPSVGVIESGEIMKYKGLLLTEGAVVPEQYMEMLHSDDHSVTKAAKDTDSKKDTDGKKDTESKKDTDSKKDSNGKQKDK